MSPEARIRAGELDMPGRETIGIIVPVHNSALYVADTIRSLEAQSVRDIEIIVVDDCSTDDTVSVIRELAGLDPRIRLIVNSEDVSVSEVRRTGAIASPGEWIALCDSDDKWEPDKLAKQIARQKETGADIVYTGASFVYEDGTKPDWIQQVPEHIEYRELLKQNIILNSSVMVRKDLYIDNCIAPDNSHEDFCCWIKLLRNGAVCSGINEPLLIYTLKKSSKSGSKLRSFAMNWRTYRFIGLNVFMSLYYSVFYVIRGIRKYSHL